MNIIKGKGVFGGVAIGRISLYRRRENIIKRYHIDDTEAEIGRFKTAKAEAIRQLKDLYEKAVVEVGEANAMIFDIHQMMLDDQDYCESIENIIKTEQVNAEYAVGTTADNFAQMFSSMDDPYMKERAADVRDISERVIGLLSDAQASTVTADEPVIVAADDLAPSETVQLDKDKVLGFVTVHGSSNSHTAILARTMNIPAIIGAEGIEKFDGCMAVADGLAGVVYIDPDEATLTKMRQKQAEERRKKELLNQLKGQDNVTIDGKRIDVFANIGNPGDVGAALENDAGGIGLFRSEFLYLESNDFPTEEQQFAAYKTVVQNMAGRKVVIRTLDVGADKQVDYFKLPKEENPAMGYRAIRICLTRPEIFKTQLRALYRASAFGRVAIMFPMITAVDEVLQIKEIAGQVRRELTHEGIAFSSDIELGIMIETPAAALISDLLAREVDFFSIGTNDLTQYTLAVDRQNQQLDPFYDPHHPAVLRMIQQVAKNAHDNGIWVGICGELGADLSLIETFLSYGIDELSVSPGLILPLRDKIRSIDTRKR